MDVEFENILTKHLLDTMSHYNIINTYFVGRFFCAKISKIMPNIKNYTLLRNQNTTYKKKAKSFRI